MSTQTETTPSNGDGGAATESLSEESREPSPICNSEENNGAASVETIATSAATATGSANEANRSESQVKREAAKARRREDKAIGELLDW